MILQTKQPLVAYRVVTPHDVGRYPADFVQVSAYYRLPKAVEGMLRTVEACRSSNVRYVLHPVDYPLSHPDRDVRARVMEDMRIMARHADMAIIVHDETMPYGSRLSGEAADAYGRAIEELSEICPVSVENSGNSHDIRWFWDRFGRSITLDIGHLEAANIDSGLFVADAAHQLSERLDFVHLHRVNTFRKGLADHWGLVEGCRELGTLERVLSITRSCGIILEIIEQEDVEKSLDLLRKAIAT
jgi:sugar phosphate isomerase/epimerase